MEKNNSKMVLEQPTLSNLTNSKFGVPPKTQNELLQQLGLPHISSFNYFTNQGLDQAIADLDPIEFALNDSRITLSIVEANLNYPMVPTGTVGVKNPRIYPSECRQRAASYRGKFVVTVNWTMNGVEQPPFEKDMGELPIMVKSNRCHLSTLTPEELVKRGEHEQEWGGYFVVKGHERLVRMLLMTRRNYPIAIRRSGWKGRGALFSDTGVSIRCVREDQTSRNNVLHFVTDGTAKLMFSYKKTLYYTPLVLVLKCLVKHTDYYMCQQLLGPYEDDAYYTECLQNMFRALHGEGLHSHEACKDYLGKMFRIKFTDCPEWYSNTQVADFILKKCVLIHLDRNEDKFNMLVFMTQKLFLFAQDKCKAEGADAVMMQELLLGGHLYLQMIKDRLQYWLVSLKFAISRRKTSGFLTQSEMLGCAKRAGGLAHTMEMFMATGNAGNSAELGLQQDKGLTIVAENINRMRYMSHFKAVHRGAFFQEMRTTEVRQLLPDAWGFICPVHTPDGSPCGLLNHLTMNCRVTDVPDAKKVANIPYVLARFGMWSLGDVINKAKSVSYVILLDGKVVGYVWQKFAERMVRQLRWLKIEGKEVPDTLEIVFIPMESYTTQIPGIYLFTGPARMMRPVWNLSTKSVEYVGTFEQVYLDICVAPEEFYKGVTTHQELSKLTFLSNLAQLIPMPDCNQSPRNMYQCQMGKQTMGTPCLNWRLQSQTKLYRLQTPASPLFRPVHYDNIDLDDFAMGTNAIVAVISYTGYDMEDAMIINKASEERGFAHGSIYKSEFIMLEPSTSYFCRDPEKPELAEFIDTDGLPFVGRHMRDGEPFYCYYSVDEFHYIVKKFRGKEECYVDAVKLCASFEASNKTACITFRVPRNPSVGDKFASRAGQKGICSLKYPMEDLPFTETGLVPDIIFNPHGFPSRMTVAMMIEVMAGKSAAIHGLVHDATPFRFTEDNTAIDYFSQALQAGGYNYHGTETMYSGIDGRELTAHIFFGIVHYQRLRHMVSDKWQVRSTGPNDILTRQPIKGRKRGGGVRFGEMERDSLISHGASFLLQDRLFHNSDKSTALICTTCGTLLGPVTVVTRPAEKPSLTEYQDVCRLCEHGDTIEEIQLPYIFKFFVTQMASCNINVKIKTREV